MTNYPFFRQGTIFVDNSAIQRNSENKNSLSIENIFGRFPKEFFQFFSINVSKSTTKKSSVVIKPSTITAPWLENEYLDSNTSLLSVHSIQPSFIGMSDFAIGLDPSLKRILPEIRFRLDFQHLKSIAKGATSTIKVVTHRDKITDAKIYYAAKVYRKTKTSHKKRLNTMVYFLREWSIQPKLDHPNILKVICPCVTLTSVFNKSAGFCLVQEYCPQGDLFKQIEEKVLTLEDKCCYLKQILQAVAYLQSQRIAHRDLKPENILIGRDGLLKLTDFGTSEIVGNPGDNESIRFVSGAVGSLAYLAPEAFHENGKSYVCKLCSKTSSILFQKRRTNSSIDRILWSFSR